MSKSKIQSFKVEVKVSVSKLQRFTTEVKVEILKIYSQSFKVRVQVKVLKCPSFQVEVPKPMFSSFTISKSTSKLKIQNLKVKVESKF